MVTAALVFGVLALVQAGAHLQESHGVVVLIRILATILGWSAPVVVQGALIEIVRNIHEGRPAKPLGALYAKARARFWPLFGASLVYGFGVIVGLLLLVVPGLIAAARWALMAPNVVLDDEGVFTALDESSLAVRGQTGRVLVVVVATFLLTAGPSDLAFYFLPGGDVGRALFSFVWISLSAPFDAHVLTVLYYRLTDPERPVIHEDVVRWRSVWAGA